MQFVDTLIQARWVLPIQPSGTILEYHTLALQKGRIIDILPSAQAQTRYHSDVHVERNEHVLMPGLINAHTHAGMNLLRGLADDLPLMEWLNEHIWPAENRWVDPEFTRDSVQLAIAEMIRGGITCFSDMFYFPEVTAQTAASAGMRACIGLIVLDFPTQYAANAEDYLRKGLGVYEQCQSQPLLSTALAPHAPYTVSDDALVRIRSYADELALPIHMHVHETTDEIARGLESFGTRPLARLANLGLVSPALNAVHMTQLTDEEIDWLAVAGGHVIHCPESNLKLASGFCPVHKLLERGVNVALGTDGAASNNDLDMFGEMRTAALLAKGVSGDATALSAETALRMATINGAIALGLSDAIGTLEVDKSADIIAVKLNDVETLPFYDLHSQLVYATGRDKVTDVWIEGQQVLKDRQMTTLDETLLKDKVRIWNTRILASGT